VLSIASWAALIVCAVADGPDESKRLPVGTPPREAQTPDPKEIAPPDFLKGCFYPLISNSPCEQAANSHPDWTRNWRAKEQSRQEKEAQVKAPLGFLSACFYPLVPNSPCEREAKAHPDWTRQWAAKEERLAKMEKTCPERSKCWTRKMAEWDNARRQVFDARDQAAQDTARTRFDDLGEELCGYDSYRAKRLDLVGMRFEKVMVCTGEAFNTVSQVNTAEGALTTYRMVGYHLYLHVLGGVVTSWDQY
jgi:hypothetical protein